MEYNPVTIMVYVTASSEQSNTIATTNEQNHKSNSFDTYFSFDERME